MIEQIKKHIKPGTAYEDSCIVIGVDPLTRDNYNHLPQYEGDYDWAEHRIKRVADAMSKIEDYKANYRDTDQYKWLPVFWFSGSCWSFYISRYVIVGARIASRLTVGSEEASDYLAELMIDEYAVIHNAK